MPEVKHNESYGTNTTCHHPERLALKLLLDGGPLVDSTRGSFRCEWFEETQLIFDGREAVRSPYVGDAGVVCAEVSRGNFVCVGVAVAGVIRRRRLENAYLVVTREADTRYSWRK